MSDIDNIFKEAAQNQKGDFKSTYWDDMSMLIDKDKRKRKGFWWFFSVIGVALLIGTLIFCNLREAKNKGITQTYVPREINTGVSVNQVNQELQNENKTERLTENSTTNNKAINSFKTEESNNKKQTTEVSLVEMSPIKKAKKQEGNLSSIFKINEIKSELDATKPEAKEVNKINGQLNSKEIYKAIKQREYNAHKMEVYNSRELGNMIVSECMISKHVKKPEVIIIPDNDIKKHSLSVLLGGVLYDDFNINSKKTILNTGLIIGMEYEYSLSSNLSLSSQILGYNRTSKTSRLIFSTTEQSFGEIEKTAIYDYSDFYFVEVPLNINYYLSSKHKIGFGPYYTRLITSRVNILKQESDFNLNTKTSNSIQKYVYHFDTFTRNNYGISVNYEYRFNHVGLNVGYAYGLNNFINQATFKTSFNNNLSKLYVGLKYSLF